VQLVVAQTSEVVIDWARFAQARSQLGSNFVRVIDYFREDGTKSVTAIEDGMRALNPIAMVGPADLLKMDAMQIGALSVAELAEDVEHAARDCIEWQQSPADLLHNVVQLRSVLEGTLEQLDREVNPLLVRRV
jgi:histidine phosphotransfer protein HptB